LHRTRDVVIKSYTYWKSFETLVVDMQQKLAPGRREFTFADILSILEAVNERVGRRVDESNCQDVGSRLLKIEEANGTGRVRLRDFYESHLDEGNWQFQEREEFLRHLGVLDESDPSSSRVMIPNYLNLQANCLNVSNLYDLCCMDKCEDLLGHLESQVQAPYASAERILSLVADLPSARGPGQRTLSASLVTKLHEVAEQHSGLVPLHGRLFAQWMHFAYPRDCPFPHVAGTTKVMTGSDWVRETGLDSSLTRAEMESYLASLPSSSAPRDSGSSALGDAEGDDEEEMCMAGMWAPQEELVDAVHVKLVPSPPPLGARSIRSVMRFCALVAVVLSSATVMKGAVQHAVKAAAKEGVAKPLLPMTLSMGMCGAKDAKALV